MRKKIFKSAVFVITAVLVLSVTACGGSDESANDTDIVDAEDSEDMEVTADVSEKTDAENTEDAIEEDDYVVLEDFFEDPDIISAYDEMLTEMEEPGTSISYRVSDNDFFLTLQFTDSSMVTNETADFLITYLEEKADQFKAQAGKLDEIIGREGACTLTVQYTDPDGNVIEEGTFSAG